MSTYYFIGIKGSGMSALASILHDLGNNVLGSDIEKELFTEIKLRERNITMLPFNSSNIKEDYIVIASNAYNDSHEEVIKAKEISKKFYRYHDFLGEFSKQYKSIAVSGTHGKTTTTTMLTKAFIDQKNIAFLIGDGTGHADMNNEYFIYEACEYRRHFLSYYPEYTIMTNIELDHVDYYKDIEDYKSAFKALKDQTSKYVIACGDDLNTRFLKDDNVIFYGINEYNDVVAKNIDKNPQGFKFDVYIKGEFIKTFELPFYGNHNVLNALSVITVAHLENLDMDKIEQSLQNYKVASRRFNEYNFNEQVLVDDYAHHPTEIDVTIEAARQKYPEREVIAVFQPHTFTRTKKFLNEFSESLKKADKVYLIDIFASAREASGDISINDLLNKIENAEILNNDNLDILKRHNNGIILFMGAGDVNDYMEKYIAL